MATTTLRQAVLARLADPHYAGQSFKKLAEALHVSAAELTPVLQDLSVEGLIFLAKRGDYFLSSRYGMVKAEIVRSLKNFAIATYLDSKGEKHDVKISNNELQDAYCHDTILLSFFSEDNGSVFKVLERGNKDLVGEFHRGAKSYVTPDDDNLLFRVYIKPQDSMNAVEGHKVVVAIDGFEPEVHGFVTKILGHRNDPKVDIMSQVYKHRVPYEFPEDVLKEAESKPATLSEADLKGRTDFRDHLICTIDGKDAKDLDDAVEVQKLPNGNYQLGVHIADVSHYVTKGSLLDKEAFLRGTSVYMADSVIPMLPHVLSNGICSLNPHEDRLTMSCVMEINKDGKVLKYKIGPSVIKSTYRLNYDDVNAFLAGKFHFDEPLEKMLKEMQELSEVLHMMKKRRGAFDLDAPEAKIIVDEQGHAIDIKLRQTGLGERLIEDFMVAANETTATHIANLHKPYIYRVHDKPKPERLAAFNLMLQPLGYKLRGEKEGIKPEDLQALLDKVRGKEIGIVISTMMLRSFAKAIYDSVNIGHFGLGSKCYSHFTSPIRRYPDLLAHRLQKIYLSGQRVDLDQLLEEITFQAMQCSVCERRADELERAVDDMKKAEYMSKHIGEIFDGMVSTVIASGFFVEFPNTIEGMVRFENMRDYFSFDAKTLTATGENSHQVIRIGDKVKVKVKAVDIKNGKIEFEYIRRAN